MIAGVSTACFYPLETEESLKLVADCGVAAAEVFLNAPSELSPDFLKGLYETALGRECSILSLHPFSSAWEPMLLFSGYKRRNKDGLAYYRRFFEAASILHAKYVVLHGAFRGQNITPTFYCEQYWRLARIAAEYGVTLAQENVVRFKTGDIHFLEEMKRQLPEAKFVLDTKQAVRSGLDPMVVAKRLGTSICHVHISDNRPDMDCVPMGAGTWDCKPLLRYLQDMGYTGGVMQEVYRDSYETPSQVFAGYEHLKAAVDSL